LYRYLKNSNIWEPFANSGMHNIRYSSKWNSKGKKLEFVKKYSTVNF